MGAFPYIASWICFCQPVCGGQRTMRCVDLGTLVVRSRSLLGSGRGGVGGAHMLGEAG